MQNIHLVIVMCEKFHNDRLRNDRALVRLKYDSNNLKNKNITKTTLVALEDPFPGPKHCTNLFVDGNGLLLKLFCQPLLTQLKQKFSTLLNGTPEFFVTSLV